MNYIHDLYKIVLQHEVHRLSLKKESAMQPLVDYRIMVPLRLLSSLCDGQKKTMQDILREEKLFMVN